MALTLVTAATIPLLTTAEAKLHLRVSQSAEDTLIDALVTAATQEAEHIMQRAILTQTWRLTFDNWPDWSKAPDALPSLGIVCLPLGKIASITSLKYADPTTGTMTTLTSGTDFDADLTSDFQGRLYPGYNKTWPAVRIKLSAIECIFVAGWTAANLVPTLIKQWVLLRVAALYENRAAWTEGKAIQRNEFIDRLLDRYTLPTL